MLSASAAVAQIIIRSEELPRARRFMVGRCHHSVESAITAGATLNSACFVSSHHCSDCSSTPHSQDTHPPYAIPHYVASTLACTRYAVSVPPTARVAWLRFRWGGQLHSDSTIIADTDTNENTRHNSHLNPIPSQCLDSRRLPTSRPGRPSPSTMTSECF